MSLRFAEPHAKIDPNLSVKIKVLELLLPFPYSCISVIDAGIQDPARRPANVGRFIARTTQNTGPIAVLQRHWHPLI